MREKPRVHAQTTGMLVYSLKDAGQLPPDSLTAAPTRPKKRALMSGARRLRSPASSSATSRPCCWSCLHRARQQAQPTQQMSTWGSGTIALVGACEVAHIANVQPLRHGCTSCTR